MFARGIGELHREPRPNGDSVRKTSQAAPAKLSPPRLVQALPRERLFNWLDAERPRGAIWLGAPPGAGKTMLLASYGQARSLRCLWYRLDADDNDLGRFFATLDQAVDGLRVKTSRPRFAAEHVSQPLAYARAWFRATLAAVPRPLALVFDNLDQAALPALPALLACAITELPDGVCLFMSSRHAPPPELSGAVLAGTLAVLPADALEFSADEAALYARALGQDESQVVAASRRVRGWAAGLRLLSHHRTHTAHSGDPPLLFDYFAGLLHEGLSASGQRLLLVSALLPWVPADLVAAVAGVPDARQTFEHLCANNLFTERVDAANGVYRLHPLLREFLLDRGRRSFEAGERAGLLQRAAQGFLARGEPDVSLDLLLDAQAWPAASALLLSVFDGKLALGQLDQLAGWAQRLPPSQLHLQPWLRYGLARLCFLREDATAIEHYAQACQVFAAQGDLRGQQLCAAGVLEWSYNSDSFIDHARWSALLRQPLPADAPACSQTQALRLLNGRLLACFFDGDFEADAAHWVSEVSGHLAPGSADNEKLSAAITLLGCLERHKRWDDAQWLAGQMQALIDSEQVGPRLKILARQQIAVDLHRQTGAYDQARRLALTARAQAREQGFVVLEFEAIAVLLFAALYGGEEAEARKLLDELAPMTDPASVYHQRFARQMHAWHALQCGHLAVAREHADALRAAVERSDMPAHFRATWLQLPIYVRFAEGDEAAACAELAAMCADAESGSRQVLEANLLSLQAWRHWRAGRAGEAAAALARGWALAAATRYYQLLAPLRQVLAELAAFALEHGVTPTFAGELIRRRGLRPPSVATAHWPWPLRIQTLGRFALVAGERPLVFDGKLPKKPLALLKALLALGAHEVPEHRLTDALWPDADADAAHDAFNVALHRLRKLIPQGSDVVRLQDGHVSLDAGLCWIDWRAFEALVAEADRSAGGPGDAALEALRRALALYEGHFLADDRDEAWSLPARERLRSKFNRVVIACGRALSAAGREAEALDSYRRGLETDDLAEEFYQGVMRCALVLQRPAEGLTVYYRLERMLARLFGIAPSPASQALRQSLLAPNSSRIG